MMKLAVAGIFTLFVLLNVSTVNARLVTDRKHTILARFKQQDSTATPTTQPFIPPTAAPVSCNTANFTFNVSLSTGFIDANFTQGDATQPTLTWVDIHVSKNCPNAAATCPLPFVQDPFDMPYALNLHASSDANAFSTPGASFISDGTNNRVFHWHIATDVMFLTPQDKICYSFTYTFGSDACNYGNCLL